MGKIYTVYQIRDSDSGYKYWGLSVWKINHSKKRQKEERNNELLREKRRLRERPTEVKTNQMTDLSIDNVWKQIVDGQFQGLVSVLLYSGSFFLNKLRLNTFDIYLFNHIFLLLNF